MFPDTQCLISKSSGSSFLSRLHAFVASFLASAVLCNSSLAADTRWTRIYNGAANGSDDGIVVRVDPSGNVFIGGSSQGIGTYRDFVILKYGRDGSLLWEARYDGPAHGEDQLKDMELGPDGSVYATGPSSPEIALVKWDGDGTFEWGRRFSDNFLDYFQQSLVIDSAGNAYVAGPGQCGGTNPVQVCLFKYSASGDSLWSKSYDQAEGAVFHWAEALALGSDGTICVVGGANWLSEWVLQWVILKYDSESTLLWNHPNELATDAVALRVKAGLTGDFYVMGQWYNFSEGADSRVVRFLPDGDTAWSREYFPDVYFKDGDLLACPSGGVYVNTHELRAGYAMHHLVTFMYDDAGNVAWNQMYTDPADSSSIARDLAAGVNGNVHSAGHSISTSGTQDLILAVYDSSGNELDRFRYAGAPGAVNTLGDLATLPSGASVLVGTTKNPGGTSDILVMAVSTCDCPCGNDPACDSVSVDVRDVVSVIETAFRGGDDMLDPLCAKRRADVDCSGSTDVLDVVLTTDVAFRGSDPSTKFCDPCQ